MIRTAKRSKPATKVAIPRARRSPEVDAYLARARFPPGVRSILKQIRLTIRKAAPEAEELRFPLSEPIPLALIGRIARLRARQDRAQAR